MPRGMYQITFQRIPLFPLYITLHYTTSYTIKMAGPADATPVVEAQYVHHSTYCSMHSRVEADKVGNA
jgi:hypothetical protein